jgi:nucleotidyltransferase substrate binding protein (TIGR01987 family)
MAQKACYVCGSEALFPEAQTAAPGFRNDTARKRIWSKLKPVKQNPDIRWIQRLRNFERALSLLQDALKDGPAELSLLEKEGVIQRFEYTLELAWKTVKDYLEETGLVLSTVTPRQVLKDAVDAKVIVNGQVWTDMVNHRNLLSHTYDSSVFEQAVDAIAKRYLPAIADLQKLLSDKETK